MCKYNKRSGLFVRYHHVMTIVWLFRIMRALSCKVWCYFIKSSVCFHGETWVTKVWGRFGSCAVKNQVRFPYISSVPQLIQCCRSRMYKIICSCLYSRGNGSLWWVLAPCLLLFLWRIERHTETLLTLAPSLSASRMCLTWEVEKDCSWSQ